MDGDIRNDRGRMCRDSPRRKGSANAELGDSATNGNYSMKPIQSSARNESADTAGAQRGTRVPIQSSARNESADTELG